MIVWIIGLSGAGKTTLATEVGKIVRENGRKVVLIDGDVIRKVFGYENDHSISGRKKNAKRICALCKMLDEQGIDVVCSILSIFEKSREWNRKNLNNYFEVYIRTNMSILKSRDQKGLYSAFERGEINNVVGLDLNFEEPKKPNLIIENNSTKTIFLKSAKEISNLFF